MSETTPDLSMDVNPLGNHFLELFYSVLFRPIRSFQLIADGFSSSETLMRPAFFWVMGISALAPLFTTIITGGESDMLIWLMPVSALGGLVSWLLMGLFIGLLSYAFTGETRFRTFLTVSGLAVLPWLFLGPISLLKSALGSLGFSIFVILFLGIWLWTTLLFILALAKTYRMSTDRVLIILAAPFAMVLVVLSWLVGFIMNLHQLS